MNNDIKLGGTHKPVSSSGFSPQLSLDLITEPAYWVDFNFHVDWCNQAGRRLIMGSDVSLPPREEERNIFNLLQTASIPHDTMTGLVTANALLAHSRLSQEALNDICRHLNAEISAIVQKSADTAAMLPNQSLIDFEIAIGDLPYRVHAFFLREGIFVAYAPIHEHSDALANILKRRDVIARELLTKRQPVLTDLAVMVADLQDSVKICSELPPEEYFELINQIWSALASIFRRSNATHGKHVGDGIVYYFFPQYDSDYIMDSLLCAQQVRETMRKISKEWKTRKGWLNELYLNIGINEGQEWVGTFQAEGSLEFTVLGDTINHTARLSDLARNGAIWATKNLLCKLLPDKRNDIRFGVWQREPDGVEHFVESTYTRVSSLLEHHAKAGKLGDIAGLAVAEIIEIGLEANSPQ